MTGQTFTLTADGVFDHGIGDASCEEGWCGGLEGFPRPCKCGKPTATASSTPILVMRMRKAIFGWCTSATVAETT